MGVSLALSSSATIVCSLFEDSADLSDFQTQRDISEQRSFEKVAMELVGKTKFVDYAVPVQLEGKNLYAISETQFSSIL